MPATWPTGENYRQFHVCPGKRKRPQKTTANICCNPAPPQRGCCAGSLCILILSDKLSDRRAAFLLHIFALLRMPVTYLAIVRQECRTSHKILSNAQIHAARSKRNCFRIPHPWPRKEGGHTEKGARHALSHGRHPFSYSTQTVRPSLPKCRWCRAIP